VDIYHSERPSAPSAALFSVTARLDIRRVFGQDPRPSDVRDDRVRPSLLPARDLIVTGPSAREEPTGDVLAPPRRRSDPLRE
jgi:hypothetical protein